MTATGTRGLFGAPGWRNSPGPLFYGRGPVSNALRRVEAAFESRGVSRIYIGRVATNAHGHARMTSDIDVCLRPDDLSEFLAALDCTIYAKAQGHMRRIVDHAVGVEIDMIPSGKAVGLRPEQRGLFFPDPDESEMRAGIAVPTLVRLIELKLALWRFKDWGDVVELIRAHNLEESFAERLDPRVRAIYFRCYDNKVEEDSHNPEIDDQPSKFTEA